MKILAIITIILAFILWILYHKIFDVMYFGNLGKHFIGEILTCIIISCFIVGTVSVLINTFFSSIGSLLASLWPILKIVLSFGIVIFVIFAFGGVLRESFHELKEMITNPQAEKDEDGNPIPSKSLSRRIWNSLCKYPIIFAFSIVLIVGLLFFGIQGLIGLIKPSNGQTEDPKSEYVEQIDEDEKENTNKENEEEQNAVLELSELFNNHSESQIKTFIDQEDLVYDPEGNVYYNDAVTIAVKSNGKGLSFVEITDKYSLFGIDIGDCAEDIDGLLYNNSLAEEFIDQNYTHMYISGNIYGNNDFGRIEYDYENHIISSICYAISEKEFIDMVSYVDYKKLLDNDKEIFSYFTGTKSSKEITDFLNKNGLKYNSNDGQYDSYSLQIRVNDDKTIFRNALIINNFYFYGFRIGNDVNEAGYQLSKYGFEWHDSYDDYVFYKNQSIPIFMCFEYNDSQKITAIFIADSEEDFNWFYEDEPEEEPSGDSEYDDEVSEELHKAIQLLDEAGIDYENMDYEIEENGEDRLFSFRYSGSNTFYNVFPLTGYIECIFPGDAGYMESEFIMKDFELQENE